MLILIGFTVVWWCVGLIVLGCWNKSREED